MHILTTYMHIHILKPPNMCTGRGEDLVMGLLVKEAVRLGLESNQRGLAAARKTRTLARAQDAIASAVQVGPY